jgi:hypothetical protein
MQGRNSVIHPALNRIPKPEDLQKLLRAVQSGPAPVQQPINLDSGRKFVLKVQQPRSAAGLGRTRGANESPLWALCEGLNTIWEYNTADMELIFNLIEEAVYSSGQAAPVGGTSAAALAVLGELAAMQPDVFGVVEAPAQTAPAAPPREDSANFYSPNSSAAQQQAISQQFAGLQSAQLNQSPQSPLSPQSPNAREQAVSQQMAGPRDAQFNSGNSGQFNSGQSGQFNSGSSGQFNSGNSGQFSGDMSPQEMRARDPRSSQTGMQLSGNLSELGVCDLFQSISVAKMTGRLDITSGLESLEVFFEDGAPRRASFRSDSMTGPVRDITGEEVLLEGMTWRNGFFQFNAAMKSTERSPMRRLDLLLLEGAALSDYTDALANAGLEAESKPVRTAQLSEADFEKALSEAYPSTCSIRRCFISPSTEKRLWATSLEKRACQNRPGYHWSSICTNAA